MRLILSLALATGLLGQTTNQPRLYYPWGRDTTSMSMQLAPTANYGYRSSFNVLQPIKVLYGFIRVTVADVSGFGSIAIYNYAMTTKLCETVPFSLNVSGPAVVPESWRWLGDLPWKNLGSGAQCLLSTSATSPTVPNSFWMVTTSDGTTGNISGYGSNTYPVFEGYYPGWSTLGTQSTSAVSAGSGSSISGLSSLAGVSWTAASGGTVTEPFFIWSVVSY